MEKIQFDNLQETLYKETMDNGLASLHFTETWLFKNICHIYDELWIH